MDSSKRIVLGLTIVTLGVLLGGCKTNQNDNSESLKQARSLKEENSLPFLYVRKYKAVLVLRAWNASATR
nr:hypothetical protein [Limosilactobacillus reuteri]